MATKSLLLIVVALLAGLSSAKADETFSLEFQCGTLANLANPYGPYDYTNPDHYANNLPVVERYHFTPDVENLVKGITGSIYSELDYTLRAFPNHHRALNSMARLEIRDGVRGANKPAACYFERAIKFAPDDANVFVIYGIYLYKTGQIEPAIARLNRAIELAPESAEANYNLGLILEANGQFEKAAIHASEAMRLGYPLKGLIHKLQRAGYWPPNSDKNGLKAESHGSR